MFKFLESHVQKTPVSPTLRKGSSHRHEYQRYSSVDQCYSKPGSSLNFSLIDLVNQDKKSFNGQKTQRSDKQRAHSQKKLTLTSAFAPNGCYNGSLGQSQNISFINPKQANQGLKKNLQLKPMNLSKNTQLEKKGKFNVVKESQGLKFTGLGKNIRLDSTTSIQEKQNYNQTVGCHSQLQTQHRQVVIKANNNNCYASNPQNLYIPSPSQTALNSPVYKTFAKGITFDSKPVQNAINSFASNQEIAIFCQEKIALFKQQTNLVLVQNSIKIKELEALLLLNRQKLEAKDKIIRDLELSLVLKNESPQKLSPAQSSGYYNNHNALSQIIPFESNIDYLNTRMNDLDKKFEVLSNYFDTSYQKVDSKIEQMNKFMQSFVAAKIHNLKFTLKAFVSKTEQKVKTIIENMSKVQSTLQVNNVQSYDKILQKVVLFARAIKKIVQVRTAQKAHFEDLKTTINTTVDSYKHKPSYSNQQNMTESTQVNESFWNHLEDFSLQQNKLAQESSFTDDSVSYTPGLKKLNIISNNNSSVNQFALGSFPSFSKFSGQTHACKQSLNLMNSCLTDQNSMCLITIQEIARYRQGPVSVYLDANGNLRYKESESYIFDSKGKILKPYPNEITYCLQRKLIVIN